MREDVEQALIELGMLCAHVVYHPECSQNIARDAHEMLGQHKEDAEHVLLKVKIPISMYDAFEHACGVFEGDHVDESRVPEYVQSVVFQAIQDFINQHGPEQYRKT